MIAIIAGTGNLPLQACKSILEGPKKFFVISLFPHENGAELKRVLPDSIEVVQKPFYKAKTILDLLIEKKTKKVLFIGKVDKQNLLKKVKLDWLAIKLMATLATKSDMSIMNKIEEVLSQHNISLIYQNEILGKMLVPPGVLTGTLTKNLKANIEMGLKVAREMSKCDIGQTVVVKNKMVLAIEAIEGTDACIKRGIDLGKEKIVVCKAIQKNHNKKFDLPTIGAETLKEIKKGEIEVIAWGSRETFIANKEDFIRRAEELDITLVSVDLRQKTLFPSTSS